MTFRKCFLLGALALCCLGLTACGKKSNNVEVAVFQGGYGIDFYQQAAVKYEADHPGVKLHVWGNPRVWEQLRPQFVNNTPPDLTLPGWGMNYWPLIYSHEVSPLDDAMASPAYDGKGTWGSTFEPSLLKLGQYEGKQYMLPYYVNIDGWWYNVKMFQQHGWTPPQTWSQLLALCPKIKAAGIAPITYQGQYPTYMITGFLFPWVISAGGVQALNDAQDLKPGAWKSPAFLQAATMIVQLKNMGFYETGCNGMSHTESQTDFVSGKAAMIPCGTWLHTEMAKVTPPDFQMGFLLPPLADAGKDPSNIGIGIEPWIVPAKAKHRAVAIDFFKYLTSLPVEQKFGEVKGTLMSVKGSDDHPLPDFLVAPSKDFHASQALWSVQYDQWYPELGSEVQNAMTALLNGTATPQQFCDRCEAAAEKARQDKSLPKHTVEHG